MEDLHEGLCRADIAVQRALDLAQRAARLDQLSDEVLLRLALFLSLSCLLHLSWLLRLSCLFARSVSQVCDALLDVLQFFFQRLLFESPPSLGFEPQPLQVDERTIADPARAQSGKSLDADEPLDSVQQEGAVAAEGRVEGFA